MDSYQDFRQEKDHFFANHPHSPLSQEQHHHFHGLWCSGIMPRATCGLRGLGARGPIWAFQWEVQGN